jgi:ATP-binding cassette subfamily F protein uup
VDKAQNLFVKELEWMRRQPKREQQNQNRVRKIFTRLKTKHKARKENKVELEINMERMGSKIIELHNLKKFKDHVIMDNFSYDFQGERIGIIGKNGTGKSTF